MQDSVPESFWPQQWLPVEQMLAATRISTFGYNVQSSPANATNIFEFSDWAKELLLNLRFKTGKEDRPLNVGDVPLIFVSHGLGGLVAKKAYLLGRNNTNADFLHIGQAVSAFVFFSTPHRGAHLSEVLTDVLSACVPGWSTSHELSHLMKHVQPLEEINEQFRDLMLYVDTVSFYETQPTPVGTSQMLVLRKENALIGHANELSIPLHANHATITKFRSIEDANYGRVRDVLRYLVAKFKRDAQQNVPHYAEEEQARVCNFLGVDEAPEDDHNYFAEKRVDGTCESILGHEAFTSWFEDHANHMGVLWCHGKPGSGKSVTASRIIDHIKEEQLPCAYYYFRSGDQVKNNLTLFMLSIALQIASLVPEYRRKLCRLADDGFNITKAGYKMLWKKLFVSTLLKAHLKEPVFIVVDGLDELEISMAKELVMKMFVELADASQPLRLLIISRALPEIETSMDRLARHVRPRTDLKTVALDSNASDLELYVEDEMDSMLGDDTFRRDTMRQVLKKADGNFLWVHFVVKEILECLTEDDVELALNAVPSELNPLYLRMDQRLADTFRHRPNDKQLGQTILIWASCSRYPLLLEELVDALSPEHKRIIDMRQTVHRVCGEFVVVDKKSHVSMMHASARDFLLSTPDLNYSIVPQGAHRILFCKCMQKLCNTTATGRQTSPTKGRSFAQYAAVSWAAHLTASHGWLDQESLNLLVSLFQSRAVLDWILILASSGNLRTMVDASKALTGFLKIVDNADQERSPLTHRITHKDLLRSWAHDLIRIVGKFGAQIVRHPKAIYDLIPAFCPESSAIHQQFATNVPALSLKIRETAAKAWDDCLAKFLIAGESMPLIVTALERHFAILTADGMVRLFYANTCEEARSFSHGEPVLAMCFNALGDRLATYGFHKTKIWDTRTARHLFTVRNPRYMKAIAMTFRIDDEQEEVLLTLSDDACVRKCSLSSACFDWEMVGPCRRGALRLQRTGGLRNAQFSPDGTHVAISHRAAHPTVWSLKAKMPQFVAQCERRHSRKPSAQSPWRSNYTDAQAFCWSPISGHLLGIWNDGCVFKWHPTDGEYQMSDIKSWAIKCSADGKLFVTSSGDGTLRIWDFERFVPIYHLFRPKEIKDLAIDRNEACVYDIRDMHCSTWQPNALLRLMEFDDKNSDSKSSHDGSNQPSLVSDLYHEDTEPVTAMSTNCIGDMYATGNDVGQAYLYTYDGTLISILSKIYFSVDHIACCSARNVVAIAYLSRDISVRTIIIDANNISRTIEQEPLLSYGESDTIRQLLFSFDGSLLLVVTSTALKIYNIDEKEIIGILPEAQEHRWINHPTDNGLLLGFAADHLRIMPWYNMLETITCQYDRITESNAPPYLGNKTRRPSQTYPLSPSETNVAAKKVLVSCEAKFIFVETRCTTKQAARRTDLLLIELVHIDRGKRALYAPVRSVPAELSKAFSVGLGFIATDRVGTYQPRRPSAPTTFNTRRPSFQPQYGEQTFVFIDHDAWVCTINLSSEDGRSRPIRKHFFLPRDWQNSEWLELASVTPDGTFLCPRNGEVAVVSGGLDFEWVDD
ncbi:hypothetical protein PMZ80_010924 [Knufia obscura]|uniref:Uncharacterized protein n=1 Tax=Knufia obscura TaxID=1635080 RepID=A0ABR0R843_9EURO|nr:hypothetical protein PMZ80_010924 [Knufia obscura]